MFSRRLNLTILSCKYLLSLSLVFLIDLLNFVLEIFQKIDIN
jgi:hypothetical protein